MDRDTDRPLFEDRQTDDDDDRLTLGKIFYTVSIKFPPGENPVFEGGGLLKGGFLLNDPV